MTAGTKRLDQILQQGRLPRRKALSFAAQIARQMESARQQQFSFIDLHPEGIVVHDDDVFVESFRVPRDDYWVHDIDAFGRLLLAMLAGDQRLATWYDTASAPAPNDVTGRLGALIRDCLGYADRHFGPVEFPESNLRDIGAVAGFLESAGKRDRMLTLALTGAALSAGMFLILATAWRLTDIRPAAPDGEPSPQPAGAPPPASGTSRLERLFSAAWLTDSAGSPTSVDITDRAAPYLRAGTPYLLKFALSDTAFPSPPGADTPATSERIPRAPLEALKAGVELSVDYFSPDLEPSYATASIRVPERREAALVAFPIVPTAIAHDGIRIFLRLQLNTLPFYQTMLRPAVIGADETPGDIAKRMWVTGQSDVASDAVGNFESLKPGDVEIQIIPIAASDGASYPIRIDWAGRPPVQSTLGLNWTELTNRMKSVRNDLEALRNNAVFRNALDGDDIANAGTRKALLLKLATIGHALYNDLFQDPAARRILADIRTYSKSHAPTRIRIDHGPTRAQHSPRVMLPFGLLYDDPNFAPDDPARNSVDPSNFWDYRYLVEFNQWNMMGRKKMLCANGIVRLAAAMDVGTENVSTSKDWKTEVEQQVSYLRSFDRRFKIDWVPDEDSLKNLFSTQNVDHDIVYYYGHTNNGLQPSFKLTSGTALRLDALAQHIQNNHVTMLREYPLVILNSCRGAAFDGDNYNSFLDVMATVQAAAFIGTEVSVGIPFGARTGQKLLDRLGKAIDTPIVRVLWELKKDALERKTGNPLILMYSLFGDPYVRTCAS